MTRWFRRLFWGLCEYYCACGHHRCFHGSGYSEYCHKGICACSKFYPETTIRNIRKLKQIVQHTGQMP